MVASKLRIIIYFMPIYFSISAIFLFRLLTSTNLSSMLASLLSATYCKYN